MAYKFGVTPTVKKCADNSGSKNDTNCCKRNKRSCNTLLLSSTNIPGSRRDKNISIHANDTGSERNATANAAHTESNPCQYTRCLFPKIHDAIIRCINDCISGNFII